MERRKGGIMVSHNKLKTEVEIFIIINIFFFHDVIMY